AACRRRSSREAERASRATRPVVPGRGRPRDRYGEPERARSGARARAPTGGAMESLRVELGSRSYPIHIGAGIVDRVPLYEAVLGRGTAAIVTNDVVAPLYLARVQKALEAAGARVVPVVVPDGEQAKSWPT